MLDAFGDRPVTVCREMTKLHEEIWRTGLRQAKEYYDDNPPRGEFVLVISGYSGPEHGEVTLDDAAELAADYMKEGMSASDAAKRAARETGFSKSEIYRAAGEKRD